VALAWLGVLPPAGEVEPRWTRFGRLSVVLIAVFDTLQAYPVAGAQASAAALFFVPVGGLILADGLAEIARTRETWPATRGRVASLVGAGTVVALAVTFAAVAVIHPLEKMADRYFDYRPLSLEGTALIRFPEKRAKEYDGLVRQLRRSCDQFITLPGMNSFYIWTRTRPPTGMNAGNWMSLLTDDQQRRVVNAVRGVTRLCLLRFDDILFVYALGAGREILPEGPLMRFIDRTRWRQDYLAVGDDYRLLVRGRPN
jgi:hypothetical protein